jgi:hypothetical protein
MGEKNNLASMTPRQRPVPSWPTVIRTTLRLWWERRKKTRGTTVRRQRTLLTFSSLLIAGLAAALAVILLVQPGPTSAGVRHSTGSTTSVRPARNEDSVTVRAVTLARTQAARWIAQEVSPAAVVSCDPAMCSVLQAHGVPAGRLLILLLAAADPLGSDVVVATPAVRSQFGERLISVYAPEVIASFGTGAARIDSRAIAADGARAYQAALAADRAARIAAGRQLLRNHRISASKAARAALIAGDVDPRLLATLAALAAQQPVSIADFADPSPGAPDVPLRSAEISASAPSRLRPMLSFLHAQRTPYQPARILTIPAAGGKLAIRIEYGAPGPLGLGGK